MDDGAPQRHSIEPAAAALAPRDRAELMADAREMLAVLVEQLRGERTRAHARGVRLHDAEHVVERSRGPMPVPVAAKPPVVFDEVTNGYVP